MTRTRIRLLLTGLSALALLQPCATVQAVSGPRVLHFPLDRSLGKLMSRPAKPEEPVNGFQYWSRDEDWDLLGQARGDVVVPAGQQVFLIVWRPETWRDLSPLLKLQSDDLYKLSLNGSRTGGPRPGDSCMRYVAHLTGLRALDLEGASISGAGMKHVVALKQLKYLTVPGRMDDQSMALLAGLPALAGLYFKENLVTDAGLAHLAKLTSLEELELGGARITDAGLTHLAGLPRLRYLILWGKGFTDSGLNLLKAVPNLEILNLGPLEQVTDAGLMHLSQIPQLKDLDIYRAAGVTDTGISYLKKLPRLRKLDLRHTSVTDACLVHLKDVKTLEFLRLPEQRITDAGFRCMAELTELRELHVPRPHYVDPKMNKDYYTDDGVKALAGLTKMECLLIGGFGVTDTGIEHLAGMHRLRELGVYGCDRVTADSLKTIGELKNLETLDIDYARLTMSSLQPLNNLSRLKTLGLDTIVQDNSGLDLSGLVNLRDLSLHLAAKQADGDVAVWQEQDIAAMGRLTNLRRLQISHTGIPDAGVVRHLTGLKRLERLSIGGNGCTDEAVAYLAKLPNLSSLTLSGTFTDATLMHLRKVENLAVLDFMSGANFTARTLSDFRAQMPNLIVFRDFEKK